MTAGRGIIHREQAYRDERARVLQMWLNLPAADKLVPAAYQDLVQPTMPRLHRPGVTVDVHAGTVEGVTGAANTHSPVQGVVVVLESGRAFELPVPAEHRLFANVITGDALVGGRSLTTGQTGWSDPLTPTGSGKATSSSLHIATGEHPAHVMVYSGRPLHEPVALGGPFVMNTAAKITQAQRDFHAGGFGPVPRQARLAYDR